jgi:hypothetical protein
MKKNFLENLKTAMGLTYLCTVNATETPSRDDPFFEILNQKPKFPTPT